MLTMILTLQLFQMPAGMTHDEHQTQMARDGALKTRGAAAMGFDQDATVHHFRLARDGGSIDVAVRNGADEANRAAIRSHLRAIATQFADGDFAKPRQTHAEAPPGSARMAALRGSITYAYEQTPAGGRVRIRTANPEAVKAVHEFLRYQIAEHHTSDPAALAK